MSGPGEAEAYAQWQEDEAMARAEDYEAARSAELEAHADAAAERMEISHELQREQLLEDGHRTQRYVTLGGFRFLVES